MNTDSMLAPPAPPAAASAPRAESMATPPPAEGMTVAPRAEGMTAQLQRHIEQERSALARELHDEIGGALAALHLDLSWIVDHASDAALKSRALSAGAALQGAIAASRRIVQQLRPPILDAGLLPALRWLVQDVASRASIAITIDAAEMQSESQADIPPAAQLVAYRCAQEALTNAMKHAGCTQVTLSLSDRSGVLTMEVKDDGRGLTRSALDDPLHFGLRGLAERAQTVGGWLDVSSPGGAGTSIVLSIPLATTLPEEDA